ncbi:hypothetical protein Tco_0802400 [Tanacetum coccineum]|uniref:Uncharacterized protein n=1 Tax=Tanacetum coccineum TaxID=301880 RepID=A0ABQ4ZZK2_9ASTR
MKDPECVKKKVKIAPHDYSKKNYLATFTPQKQLTLEQIFWSDDLLKMKAKALKEKAKSAKPITAMIVYPPNTPAKLVPKVIPTKSQVQVNIYSLVQLFLEFDKTYKKRITPTGLTEGERALINEIKEMKEVFDQIEAEVDQNAVDKKCDEIERKNILIENENLTAECLSKDVFYTATDYVLTVSRFSDMHDSYTAAQKRIAELEAKNFNLTQKIQIVDHDEMIKHFSKLEVDHLNLKLKYQHLKERFGNKKLVTSSDAPTFELTISPNVEVSFFKLLCTTDDIEDMTFDIYIQRISLTGFPAQSVGSSNTDVLDSPCLLVLITGTSQSRQHVITSLIHIESCKSPTKSLFDVGSSRISIFTVNT